MRAQNRKYVPVERDLTGCRHGEQQGGEGAYSSLVNAGHLLILCD
jgi:hypothetical protein